MMAHIYDTEAVREDRCGEDYADYLRSQERIREAIARRREASLPPVSGGESTSSEEELIPEAAQA